MQLDEREEKIVKDIKDDVSTLNQHLVLATNNGIEVEFVFVDIREIGDEVSRVLLQAKILKLL